MFLHTVAELPFNIYILKQLQFPFVYYMYVPCIHGHQVLMLFPRLQPLVAALGWDLLTGKTTMRTKLMQCLWTSKSQALRLEESSPYDTKLDEVNML